jgi:SAM-dependent methyltransferase
MQRNGDEERVGRQAVGKNRSDRVRKTRPACIFETQGNAARYGAVGDTRNDSVIRGRAREARGARQPFKRPERNCAMRAAAIVQESKLRPARGAKPVVILDNGGTAGTAGRQHEIENRTIEARPHRAIVGRAFHRHKRQMTPPEIFDRNARRLRRGRAKGGGFFAATMIDDLLDRLDAVTRKFSDALVIGAEPGFVDSLNARGIATTVVDLSPRRANHAVDEDRLDFGSACFDLVVAVGTLDTVSDLPGALLLMRRALRPEGLMLAAFAGSPSLPTLRAVVAATDAEHELAVPRLHPQVDVRAAGDLLVRAGFAMPVADLATVDVAYSSFSKLIADLREAGATNVLAERDGVTRQWLAAASTKFADMADAEGRTHEMLSYIMLTGWASP